MDEFNIKLPGIDGKSISVPITRVHSLVIGSGAAGLNAAVQLFRNGIQDVMIVTEGLTMGTSINTGSDKQTYYKLSMCGSDADSPRDMAESYFAGGSMHGDLALVEASLSARAFLNLVNIGVPFPRDTYGQFVGYKTDHDPRQRATSIGPYTSREMCRRLIEQVRLLGISIREGREIIELLVIEQDGQRRAAGALALDDANHLEGYLVENVVFAVGGPGGLYQTSVYPHVHNGGIGLALMAGVQARNLPESQFGMASTKFRWNVSGTYMQVIPRVISQTVDGDDEQEFMQPYFNTVGEMNGKVFLKGYQWPFDARKVMDGSSIVDILIYIETVIKKRRVFLDFQRNPQGFTFEELPDEALNYLTRSTALLDTPYKRLQVMNPGAIELYRDHGIDLENELLEVAICAQHNNGGLAGNIWWESTNTRHLFPVGEVNGSHGVSRPGGTALNAGQVGSIRAAEYIANVYANWSLPEEDAIRQLEKSLKDAILWAQSCTRDHKTWQEEVFELRERMTEAGAHIRSEKTLATAETKAWEQALRIHSQGCGIAGMEDLKGAFRARQLSFAQAVYLSTIQYAVHSGVGSRGSSIILDPSGQKIHPRLEEAWRIAPENSTFRTKLLETRANSDGGMQFEWIERNPIPEPDSWFETTWARYNRGEIYRT